jgi:hypothetical protein
VDRPNPDPAAPLAAALRDLHGAHLSDQEITGYRLYGWTAEHVATVGVLARWATTHEAALARRLGKSAPQVWWRAVGQALARSGHRLVQDRAIPVGDALPWLTLLAGTIDTDEYDALDTFLFPATLTRGRPFFDWLALGSAGPLAWAAGLSLDEARRRVKPGDLDADVLRTLAGLRGFRLLGTENLP